MTRYLVVTPFPNKLRSVVDLYFRNVQFATVQIYDE